MATHYDEIKLSSKGEDDMQDITEDIQKIISASRLKEGIACISVFGSTGSLTTIEFEPGLQKDFPKAMDRIAPKDIEYKHHETWHDDNGRSHVKASLMGPSVTMPFHEGKLMHGTWQQVAFINFDTRPRERRIIVQLIGE